MILFLNHTVQECGVYQYGKRLFDILKKSKKHKYSYCEVGSYDDYLNAISTMNPTTVVFNFTPSTMPWLTKDNINKNITNIGIPHETNFVLFDNNIEINSSDRETENSLAIPRPIFENIDEIMSNYVVNNVGKKEFIDYGKDSGIPIFGSFGFGFYNKGFDKIIKLVNEQYDNAIIKMIITQPHFSGGFNSYNIVNECLSIERKPGVELLITTQFFTEEELLIFLAANTFNIFLYDSMEGRGISSCIDYAISSNKPFGISNSYMFRNVYSDDICLYKNSIRYVIEKSREKLPYLRELYSNQNLINKFDNIVCYYNDETIQNISKYISAYYCSVNYNETCNVTNILKLLFMKFRYENCTEFVANNEIFSDTQNGVYKKLFININNQYNICMRTLVYNENDTVNLSVIINELGVKHKLACSSFNVNVSFGELVDKYSILELKMKYITNTEKLEDIKNEMSMLEPFISKTRNTVFYSLIVHINELIWKDSEQIKRMSLDNPSYKNIKCYAELSQRILSNNQKRFRLKNHFNLEYASSFKEHKSYDDTVCYIDISSEDEVYDKIPEINYMCISYDIIYFNNEYKELICQLFSNRNIFFTNDVTTLSTINCYCELSKFILDEHRNNYDFKPITYVSGGRLGDFINQLSVVCENYYKTGRKGILFIGNVGDRFSFGLENAYKDTFNIIVSQKYITSYKLHNGEQADIDLSLWRNDWPTVQMFLNYQYNWCKIYRLVYNVNWAKHKWINNSEHANYLNWDDKIIINITSYRFVSESAIAKMKAIVSSSIDSCIFVSNETEFYSYFVQETGLKIPHYIPKNFSETVAIIDACKTAFLGFSSLAAIANSLHKLHYLIGISGSDGYIYNNIKQEIPHVIDILD